MGQGPQAGRAAQGPWATLHPIGALRARRAGYVFRHQGRRPARRALPSGQGTQASCLLVLVWATTSTAAAPLSSQRCGRVAAGKLCGAADMSCPHTFDDLNLPSRLRTVESTVHNTYFDYFSYFLFLFGYAASGILCAARPGLSSIASFRYSRDIEV